MQDDPLYDPRCDPLLLFVHVRKTAGSTASWVMHRHFRDGEMVDINGACVEDAARKWNSMSPARRAAVKAVRGHLPYAPEIFAPRQTTVFTILRDPVQRVISEYYFNLANAGEKFHRELTSRGMTLDEFVRGESSSEVHNAQARMLAGAPAHAGPSELLQLALRNMAGLSLVGISERLEETLLLCRAILGWRRIVCHRVNVNNWRPSMRKISQGTLETIEEKNSLDRQLYRLGIARFEELLRQHSITQAQIHRLIRVSRIYSAAHRIAGFRRELWIEAGMARARRRAASEAGKGKA